MNKIALMMRIKLNGEALNNECMIGNLIQPRQIELCDGTIRQAISGEMLKHMHSRNLRNLSEENELCDTCKIFSPMKNGAVKNNDSNLSDCGNKVRECLIDDIEGFMDARKGKNIKRNSCIQFSWAIATEENEYQTMLHTRVDSTSGNKKKKAEKDSLANEGNTNKDQNTQMLFHRPIRSNEYAVTVMVDLDRIGFDDEKLIYAVSDEVRLDRQKKCIKAIIDLFTDMEGAMCSTRLPHICGLEGVVVVKNDKNQILSKYSALNDDYIEENERVSDNTHRFKTMYEFKKVMMELV